MNRPLAILRAFWDSVVVIEEDAEFLEPEYMVVA
jgi:hypothetical protein